MSRFFRLLTHHTKLILEVRVVECRKPYRRSASVFPRDHDLKSHDGTLSKKAKTGGIYYSCGGDCFGNKHRKLREGPGKLPTNHVSSGRMDPTAESRRL